MVHRHFLIFLFLLMFSAIAKAESPWGPECETLEECIELIRAPSLCNDSDLACRTDELAQPLQGKLLQGVEKFGEVAVSPLLEILGTGSDLEVARAAELLVSNRYLKIEHGQVILSSWLRTPGSSLNLLASTYATPAFAREIIERLRKDPADDNAAHVFSNFREFPGEPPNGLTAAITEHVDCSKGEHCNSAFAKIQFDWISSNAESKYAGLKMAEVLRNPKLDETGKLAALEFFRPSEYLRPVEQMRGLAVPALREQLDSPDLVVQFQAASFLAGYGDASGADRLLRFAEDTQSNKRNDALIALTGIAASLQSKVDRLTSLLESDDLDVRRHAVILFGETGGKAAVDTLVAQIDAKDWLTSYASVSALRKVPDQRVQQILKEVGESYWHPIVRDAARQELSTKSNLTQIPEADVASTHFADTAMNQITSPIHETQDREIRNWCKSRFERDGYRFIPDFISGPEIIEQGKRASNHNWDHYRKMLLEREDMNSAVQPGLELNVNGWTLKGTTVNPNLQTQYGKTQGRLTAEQQGNPEQVILDQNIAGIFLWNGLPHVVTAGLSYRSHGTLFQLSLNKERIWSAKPVLRLTGMTQDWVFDFEKYKSTKSETWYIQSLVWINKDQSIGILGSDGAMIVRANGVPDWLGCARPTFP
jgi:hypothetical protein